MSAVTYAALVEEAELHLQEYGGTTKRFRDKHNIPEADIERRKMRTERAEALLRLAELAARNPAEIKAIMERESAEKVA